MRGQRGPAYKGLATLRDEQGYGPWKAYGSIDAGTLVWALELGRRPQAAGRTVGSVATHPRAARTHRDSRGARWPLGR